MDPDQPAPIGAVGSGSILFVKEASENKKTYDFYDSMRFKGKYM